MFGYIYKTTNKINGKIYVGQKQSEVFLAEKYLGSGVILQNAIHKYGKHNFITELIEECNSQEELNEREVFWINYFDSKNLAVGYNIAPGGQGGYEHHNTDLRWYNNGVTELLISIHDDVPSGYVKGRLNFNGRFDYSSGHVWINNGVSQLAIDPLDFDKYDGFKQGMIDRGETWRRNAGRYIRNDVTRKKLSDKKKQYYKDNPDKRVNSGSFRPGQQSHNKNKISITNGVKNKYIDNSMLDVWLEAGWYRGNTQKHKVKRLNNA